MGSTHPPASFGKIAGKRADHADVDGVYRWPAKEGEVEGYEGDGKPRQGRYATPEFFGIVIGRDNPPWVSTACRTGFTGAARASSA